MKRMLTILLALSLLLFGCAQQGPQPAPTPTPTPMQTPTPLGSYSAEDDAALAIEEAVNASIENLTEVEQGLVSEQ